MLIEEVRLRNFKSYAEETMELLPGVNAVLGENGAGKSTIIEAVGFALFDSYPYRRKEDLVRRGENEGRVEVVVSIDGDRYRVVRKCGSSEHFVARDGNRVIDGNTDVKDWVRPLVGRPDIDDLFSEVVGVPQGTFTAAFSETERRRRDKFESLLGVDEYGEAFTKLNSPKTTVEEEIRELDDRRIELATKAEDADELEEKVEEKKGERVAKEEAIGELKDVVEELEQEKEELEKSREELWEAKDVYSTAEEKLKNKKSSLEDAENDLEDAEEAAEELEDLEPEVEAYRKLGERIEDLEERDKWNRRLEEEKGEVENELHRLEEREERLREEIEEGETAEERLEGLREDIRELGEVEEELEDLKLKRQELETRLESARENLESVDEEGSCPLIDEECPEVESLDAYFDEVIEEFKGEVTSIERSIEDAEEKKNEFEDAREELQRAEDRVERGEEGREELKKVLKEKERLEEKVGDLEEKIDEEVEEELKRLKERRSDLEGKKERYDKLSAKAEELPEVRSEVERLLEGVGEAEREVEDAEEQLDEARESFDKEKLEEVEEELESKKGDIGGLTSDVSNLEERIEEMERELAETREAEQELEEVKELKSEKEGVSELLQTYREKIRDAAPFVAREMVKQVEAEADEIFSSIMGDATQRLSWDDSYLVSVREGGREKEFPQLSGGEQMAAALSVRLALTRLLSGAGLVFLDEPTQNMDEDRRNWLAQRIVDIEGFEQIVVVSHDDSFDSLTENVLYVERDGVSKVRGGI